MLNLVLDSRVKEKFVLMSYVIEILPSFFIYLSRFSSKNELASDKYYRTEGISISSAAVHIFRELASHLLFLIGVKRM